MSLYARKRYEDNCNGHLRGQILALQFILNDRKESKAGSKDKAYSLFLAAMGSAIATL